MVSVSSAAPAGHRRISSFRTSTFNFFKGNNKGSLHPSGSIRRNELTFSNPLSCTEENVSPTTRTPPSRADTEPIPPEKSLHRHKFPAAGVFEVSPGRGFAQFHNRRGSSSVVGEEEERGEGSITVGMDLRDLSPSRQTQTDAESSIDDRRANVPSARSKTKGAKLKMAALSLLRRRSNNNLRRAYVDPVDERYEMSDDREPFIEPLMDPDFIDAVHAPSSRLSSQSTVRPTPAQKSSGFKFTFSPRNHNRQVLTKQPPEDTRRPRRATVASVISDAALAHDPERPRTSVWSTLSPRPSSSQSAIHKGAQSEGEGSGGFLNGGSIGGSGGPGGGLFPRPASLQRHWSDGPRHTRDTSVLSDADQNASNRTSQDPGGIRALSFGGMLNGYNSMKITEAVTLETRVRELEDQVATLQNYITQPNFRPSRRNFSTVTAPEHLVDQNTLNVPDFPKRTYSISSAGSSDKIDSSEFPGTPKNLGPPPRPGDQVTLKVRENSLLAAQRREETLQVLEGNRTNIEGRRDTSSTIRPNRSPSPTPGVSLAQYTGLIALVKREQRARRKLESQVANLQEQMALVLHRQLLSSGSPTATDSSTSRLRPDFGSIRRKTSSEVPTPDLTPPRTSPTNYHAIPGNLFTGFDSDYDNDDDEERLFMNIDADENEVWETPAEEKESILNDSDSDRAFRETLSAFPSPQPRTKSLSQLTHKSSLATR